MKKAYLLSLVFLSASLTGCMGGEDCDTVTDSIETTVDEDQYFYFDFNTGDVVKSLEYTFERKDDEGHEIDVYLMTEPNFQQYEKDNSFVYLADFSEPATTKTNFEKNGNLDESKKYFLVIDNTDHGDSAPPSDGYDNGVHFAADYSMEKCRGN